MRQSLACVLVALATAGPLLAADPPPPGRPNVLILFADDRRADTIAGKRANEATWPEAFGRAGSTTFVSGKWHNSANKTGHKDAEPMSGPP